MQIEQKNIILMILAAMILLSGCTRTEETNQIANPASVNCIEKGGTLEIMDTPAGQIGICTLPDGTECEEWAFYNGECPDQEASQQGNTQLANPASVYCENNGGKLMIVDSPEGQKGLCTLPDGTECEEWAYFRGECPSSEHICTEAESRATACTFIYAPVCGKSILNTGQITFQTYANECDACTAMKVVSYTPGECPEADTGCSRDDDCRLTYSGDQECAPCDTRDLDYKCLSPAESARIIEERNSKFNDIECGPCMQIEPYSSCVCNEEICKKIECGSCPNLMPPGPDFCKNGNIVDGGQDECGCQLPPRCE